MRYCFVFILALFLGFCSCVKRNWVDGVPTRDNPLELGLPSPASADNPLDYLLKKPQYALSYHRDKGRANWVAWHLSPAWRGEAPRSTSFRIDPDLPTDWPLVSSNDYTNTGFDRGHLCPSEDRDASVEDNAATFVMSNVVAQTPALNRGPWAAFEQYLRQQIDQGLEAYVYAGPWGRGGQLGSNPVLETLGRDNRVEVPAWTWKVVLLLPIGQEDLRRVAEDTRIITVLMPNTSEVSGQYWGDFRISVDSLETLLGYDFFNRLSPSLQAVLEAKVDNL